MKVVSGKAFAQILERKGWVLVRVRGSHHVFMKQGNPARISIPIHGNQPLKKGLQRFFMKTAGLRDEDL